MRRQLVLVALAVTTMVVVAFALPLGVTVARLADNLAAQEAEDAAGELARAVGTLMQGDDDESLSGLTGDEGDTQRAVYLPERIIGEPIDHDEITSSLAVAWSGRGVTATDGRNHVALLPVFTDQAEPVAVAVAAVPRATSTRSVWTAWFILGALSLTMVGLSAFLADRLGRQLVRPVVALADGARRLAAGDLDTTVPIEGPAEVRETAAVFNRLGQRIRDLLQDERESIADLSHRLRTPLTALRLEMEGRSAAAIVDELAASVDDIIREAREPQGRHLASRTDLTDLVGRRATFWGALADEEGRTTTLELPPLPCIVEVNHKQYGAAVDALLENVFAHTPPGVGYGVELAMVDDEAVLTVQDAGPGLPRGTDHLSRGSSSKGSTGLGLDICVRLARSHGGTFTVIPSRLGGAGFRLTVPQGFEENAP